MAVVYRPRSEDEIRAGLVARFVARPNGVTDVTDGGVIASILGVFAEEVADVENRLYRLRQAFDFVDAVGADLDARVGDLPGEGLTRLGPSFASGPLAVTTTNADAIPAGQKYSRNDGSPVQYVQTASVTPALSDGVYTATVNVSAAVAGSAGTAPAATITNAVGGAANISNVTQPNAISGLDRETDEQLKKRALNYLSSIGQVQPAALIFVALSFKSSTGIRFRHASVYTDPTRPGYAELVVDDGTGLSSYTRTGAPVTVTIPVGGQRVLTHEQPAVDPIGASQLFRDIGGAGSPATIPLSEGSVQWTSIPELGEIYLETGVASSSDVFSIGDTSIGGMSSYDVFTGPIAELQAQIQGNPADPTGSPGNISAGCRVRVLPPDPENLTFSINLVVDDGVDLVATRTTLKNEIVEYMRGLEPGEQFRINDLARALMLLDGVKNITFRQTDTIGADVTYTDQNPSSPRKALRATTAGIEVV